MSRIQPSDSKNRVTPMEMLEGNEKKDGMSDGEEDELDEELQEVTKGLKAIENVMIAEQKRRLESNTIMNNFIEDFIRTL